MTRPPREPRDIGLDATEYLEALRHPASRAAMALRRRMRPRTRFLHGVERLRTRWLLVIQAALAAGLAYWFALDVLGHENPFFAPMAAFIGLNVMVEGPRLKFSLELVLGAALGVGVGDVIFSVLGPGVWQLTVGVLVAMMIGVFVGRGPLVVNQAASSAVLIATIMPPGSTLSYERMVDALVGGLIGVLVMALIPRNPVSEARRTVATVLDLSADVLYDVARGLEDRDADRIRAGLQVARASQADVTLMDRTIADGVEQVQLSPLLWNRRRQFRSLARLVHPVDNAVRNIRVLARRAITSAEDNVTASDQLVALVMGVSQSAHTVRRLLDDAPSLAEIPEWGELPHDDSKTGTFAAVSGEDDSAPVTHEAAIRELRILAAKMRPAVVEGATLSEIVIFAQCRSLVVDLLQVCGLSRLSAVAALPPTVSRPAMPPEVWDLGEGDGQPGAGSAL
ncbi:FUSC family protein [Corynebacterium freneyi]|uniref:FUSC family protein n=1 Tax=Corynebacterium freneyi TaxID=134034 RepID=UPI00068B52B0|nr:FUSC family protein [Corynebacterium freneyi]